MQIENSKLIRTAQQMVESCLKFRQPRLDEIKKSEDMYLGKTQPALKGRFNIPIPILEGFVETLMSKIDDTIKVSFGPTRESTLKASKKVSSAWERDSSPDKGKFNEADLDAKKLAIFSGFGVLKLTPFTKPYKQTLDAVDYHDFLFEPLGGRDLNKHLYKGEINVFKTKEELREGVEKGIYIASGVNKLINSTDDDKKKNYQEAQQNKANRFMAMGLDTELYSYTGSDVYNLTQLCMRYGGKEYYVLFEKEQGIAIRIEELKKIFKSGLSPYVAWHTTRNPVNFLCKAPVDGIRPAAEAMRLLINQTFDNIQKRNWNQVFVSAKKVKDFGELQWKPNGIVRLNLKDNESVQNAYQAVETPDTTNITINLMDWLNNFIGEKSGITPASQGVSDEDKVGIYFGNIQQVADRLGMTNKFYRQAHIEIAERYKANLAQYMPSRNFMVKFIGLKGVCEEELKKEEANEELDVAVSSETAEAQMDEIKQKKRTEALTMVQKDELLRQEVSSKWLLEQILRNGEYEEQDIKFALAKEDGADAELLSEAAKAIEEIVSGQEPSVKLNRGANLAFIKKIRDYAYQEETLPDEIVARLIEYATKHLEVVQKNAMEEAQIFAQAQPIQGQQPINQNNAGQTPTVEQNRPTQEVVSRGAGLGAVSGVGARS